MELICDGCGKEFSRYKSLINEGENFCSKECYKNNREDNRKKVSCNNCGKKFKVHKKRYKIRDNFYCSKNCEKKWRTNNSKQGKDHELYDRIETCCDYCGDEIKIILWDYKNYKHNFCGDKCKNNWRSENIKGKNHPNWKDGSSPNKYPREFYRMREDILERDNSRCVLCRMNEEEHKDKYKKGLCVHHVDGDVYNNESTNLVTLCQRCNSKIEYLEHRPSIKELKGKKFSQIFNTPQTI